MSADSKNSTPWLWLAALTAVAAILRLIHLQTAISWDEAIIYFWISQNPFSWILSYYENVGNHVLLTILTAWSYYIFGPSLWALRIPAFLAGVLLIPVTYVLARALTNERSARLAAGVAAGCNFLILYSVNERGYGLQATLVVFLLWAWAKYWETKFNGRFFVLSVLALTLALYTLPTTLFLVPALACTVFCFSPSLREIGPLKKMLATALPIGVSGVLTFALYLPILLNAGMGGTVNNSYLKSRLSFSDSCGELLTLFKQLWVQSLWGIPTPAFQLVAVLIALGLLRSFIRKPALAVFLLGTFAAIVFALLGFQPAPVRAFVFFVPLGIVLLTYGVDALVPNKGRLNAIVASGYLPIAVALLLGSNSVLSDEMLAESSRSYGRERGADEYVAKVSGMIQPGDYVERVVPQMVYWMERLQVPRFPEFYEEGFLKDGKRVFVSVRHLRESLARVLHDSPFGHLKVLTLKDFREPQYLGRYGDFDLYMYERIPAPSN